MKNDLRVGCNQPLCPGELSITHKNGIEIDYCPHCKGVWLDKGELDKLLEAQEQELKRVEDYHYQQVQQAAAPPYRPPQPEPQRYYDPYYKHHKKKSIWKDLFDFD